MNYTTNNNNKSNQRQSYCSAYKNKCTPPKPPKPIEDAFAQIYDPNLDVEFKEHGYIQLLGNADTLMERGGFSVTTTTVENDTLNFAEIGVYLVNINLEYSFLPPNEGVIGTPYQVVIASKPINIPMATPSLVVNTGLSTLDTVSGILSRSFLVNVPTLPAALRLYLSNFNFDVAFDKSINISSNIINVTKISSKPYEVKNN